MKQKDVLLQLGDMLKLCGVGREVGLACAAENFAVVRSQAPILEIPPDLLTTPGAGCTCQMPSLVVVLCTFVFDWLSAQVALVGIMCREPRHSGRQLQGGRGLVIGSERLEVAEVVQKAVEAIWGLALFLDAEGSLEADADEKLQVVSKTSDEGEQVLGDAGFASRLVLGF